MDYAEYLRRLPKVELHCYVDGTLRPSTVGDLAAKHGIALPTADVSTDYDYETIYEFLTTHPITKMIAAGVLVHLNSDDPTMFRTDIPKEYVDFCTQNAYPPDVA
jgi:adenosine deaminase